MLFRLALAALLALPVLLLSVVLLPIQILLSLPSVWLLLWGDAYQTSAQTIDTTTGSSSSRRRHVIITGGSSGIGLGVALEAARQGDRVTILARDATRLAAAKQYIQETIERDYKQATKNKVVAATTTAAADVTTISVDVTDFAALETVAKVLLGDGDKKTKNKDNATTTTTTTTTSTKASVDMTTICSSTHIFMCAGQAEPQYFQELEPEAFARQVRLNLLGSTYSARAFIPYLVNTTTRNTGAKSSNAKGPSTLTFCSSMAGQIGVFGYSAYSPTKFALRGLAEVLTMEYYSQPIHIQVAYPPDTATPGYEQENTNKPYETILVSGGPNKTSHAADPLAIGRTMYHAAATTARPRAHVYFDLDGFLLATLCCGFSPVTTLWDGVAQVCGLQIVRWVALFYVNDWKRLLRDYRVNHMMGRQDEENKQNEKKEQATLKNNDKSD